MNEVMEPIVAGLIVSLINRYIIGNMILFSCCQNTFYEVEVEVESDNDTNNNSGENTTIYAVHGYTPAHVAHN
jgi:hypothetical protein